jgi:hypothetical protein
METITVKEPNCQTNAPHNPQVKLPVAVTRASVFKELAPKDAATKDVVTKELVKIAPENTTLNRFSNATTTTSTRRSSYASITKAQLQQENQQLRKTNQQLSETIQSIQVELATHRALMLDVQARLSFLEQDTTMIEDNAPTMVEGNAPEDVSPTDELKPPQRSPPPPPPRRASSLIPPGRESQSWWQACQNFAENCDTPFNAQEFLGTPSRFEDFDFHFGGLPTAEGKSEGDAVRPVTPPAVEEVPQLSPESQRQSSESDGPRSPSIFSDDEGAPRTSGLTIETIEEDNIIEQIVEFKKPAALPPLLLHPPPSGKTASLMSVEELTALPEVVPKEVVSESQRHRKGMRSISTKWASLKGKSAENEYRKGFFSMR